MIQHAMMMTMIDDQQARRQGWCPFTTVITVRAPGQRAIARPPQPTGQRCKKRLNWHMAAAGMLAPDSQPIDR